MMCEFLKNRNFNLIILLIIILKIFYAQGCHLILLERVPYSRNVTYFKLVIEKKPCLGLNQTCNLITKFPATKLVTQFETIQKKKCCTGYDEVEPGVCKPRCNNCTNGTCLFTDYCVCNKGFRRNYMLSKCLSECNLPCINGNCIGKDKCECNNGYKLNENSQNECIPDCNELCPDDDCIEPGVCISCDPTNSTTTNSCESFCNDDCINGFCSGRNECSCNDGYEQQENSTNICEPICISGCPNGKCVEPNKCSCNDGYEQTLLNHTSIESNFSEIICSPICRDGCENGLCTKPSVCECLNGYELKIQLNDKNESSHICSPICKENCINGNCIAPDLCDCNKGYAHKNHAGNLFVCEPICNKPCHRNGFCESPNQCVCKDGFQFKNNQCRTKCDLECHYGKCDNYDDPNSKCNCYKDYQMAENSTMKCLPICEKSCGNGICLKPNFCLCDSGYEFNYVTKTCTIVCPNECINGICQQSTKINSKTKAESYCECYSGFEFKNNSNFECKPICDPICELENNGVCIGPKICACKIGYDNCETNSQLCEPICEPSCINSKCIDPNVCECLPDHEKNFENNLANECLPICLNENGTDCTNGYCIEPNKCECFDGYKLSKNDKMLCEPVCNPICEKFSKCISPNICNCIDGYENIPKSLSPSHSSSSSSTSRPSSQQTTIAYIDYIDSISSYQLINSNCVPICNMNCTNGYCSLPNQCNCYNDDIYDNKKFICLPKTIQNDEMNNKSKSSNWIKISLGAIAIGIFLCLIIFIVFKMKLVITNRLNNYEEQTNIGSRLDIVQNPVYHIEES